MNDKKRKAQTKKDDAPAPKKSCLLHHIIDVVHGFDNIPSAEQPSERDDGSFLFVQKMKFLMK